MTVFRAVFHRLFGVPSHHMNIRRIGVQHMKNYPEKFIVIYTDKIFGLIRHNRVGGPMYL